MIHFLMYKVSNTTIFNKENTNKYLIRKRKKIVLEIVHSIPLNFKK